jgi:hypothetical protein
MYNLGSNDARAQSAKSEPSHVHPPSQTNQTGARAQSAKAEPSQVLESNDARALSQVMCILESNDARAHSAKSEPSHVQPAKQTKPTPGLSLHSLSQVRSLG